MYYFVYQINTIALYRQEKSTILMNENKGIDNSRIKSYCAMALRLKMKKCVETIQITIANEYVTFGFSFRILVFFPFWESLNVTLFKRYRQCFSSLNPKRFRQTTLD